MKFLVSVAFLVSIIAQHLNTAQASAEWNYDYNGVNGPLHWKSDYPDCGHNKQSPINIDDSATVGDSRTTLSLSGYDTQRSGLEIRNNGHSMQVTLDPAVTKMTISGGSLSGTYVLEQFHLHWGRNAAEGSEHTIDGKAYQIEIHFVHYKDEYDSVTDAVESKKPDALAVLGVFVDVSDETGTASQAFENLADKLQHVTAEGQTVKLESFALEDLLPADCQLDFYRYSGSLTTPGCNEVVSWTVFKNPIYISSAKMTAFRRSVSVALTHNYRPVQAVNGRQITSYKATCGVTSSLRHANVVIIASLVALIKIVY